MSTIWNTWQQSVADTDEGYKFWSKDQLQEELEKRGLPKSGNKDELIERLEENDTGD